MDSEFEDVMHYSERRWLSCGNVPNHLNEFNIFMNENSKNVSELSEPMWLWGLAILTDLTSQLNDLNLKLQGKERLVSQLYSDMKTFQAKLKLLQQHSERGTPSHFPSCEELTQDEKVSFVLVPCTWMVKLLDLFDENFEARFSDFKTQTSDVCLLENPFVANVKNVPASLQMELI